MDFKKVRDKHFPLKLKNGYKVIASDQDEVLNVMRKDFNKVFPLNDASARYQIPENRRPKLKTLVAENTKSHHEWFLFLDPKGKVVGWFIGEAENVVTFYMRNTGIRPRHRGKGIYTAFLKTFEKYLTALGYERITSQHKVTNKKILLSKINSGFIICSLELTEMFGPLVKLVKIIHKDRRNYFIKHFGESGHENFF